jgi:hypothetical protein
MRLYIGIVGIAGFAYAGNNPALTDEFAPLNITPGKVAVYGDEITRMSYDNIFPHASVLLSIYDYLA